jgi:ribose transport system permease protein
MSVEALEKPERLTLFPLIVRRHQGLIMAAAFFLVIFGLLQLSMSSSFGYYDVSSTLGSCATIALAAMGQSLVVILKGLDLSAGAVISLVNVTLVVSMQHTQAPAFVWVLLGMGVGATVGAFNGVLVAYMRLQPIVVTLASMFICQGVTLLVMKEPGGSVPPEFSSMFVGDLIPDLVPMPLVVLLGAVLIWGLIRRTRFGTNLFAVGGDEEAARANGINTSAVKFFTYVLAGVFFGFAGVFLTAQTGSGDPLIGPPLLLPIFVAVVLGGTPLSGGKGGLVGCIFGALTLILTTNVLLVMNISTYYSTIVEGILLILAVLGSSISQQSPLRRQLRFFQDKLRSREILRGHGAGLNPRPLKAYDRSQPIIPIAESTSLRDWLRPHEESLRFSAPSYLALIIVLIVTATAFGSRFQFSAYLNSLLVLTSFLAVLALGQGSVILSGGLDLSVPWMITLAGVVLTGLTLGSNAAAFWAVPLVICIGVPVGFVNGAIIVVLGVSPIVVTLAMNGVLQGAALIFSNGSPIGASPPIFRWVMTGSLASLTPILWFLAAFVVFATLLLGRTTFGRRLYAVGSNQTSARFAGVPVGATVIGAYVVSSVCSCFVGIMLSGFSGQAFNGMGDAFLLPSIAVVVVGGTLIGGGRGHYLGMLGGALLLTAIATLLSASLLPDAVRQIIFGSIVLASVVLLKERRTS